MIIQKQINTPRDEQKSRPDLRVNRLIHLLESQVLAVPQELPPLGELPYLGDFLASSDQVLLFYNVGD